MLIFAKKKQFGLFRFGSEKRASINEARFEY